MRTYILNILIGADQLVNCVLWGMPDETLSARSWRFKLEHKILGAALVCAIDALFFSLTFGAEKGHCKASYESELTRNHLPKSYSHGTK